MDQTTYMLCSRMIKNPENYDIEFEESRFSITCISTKKTLSFQRAKAMGFWIPHRLFSDKQIEKIRKYARVAYIYKNL